MKIRKKKICICLAVLCVIACGTFIIYYTRAFQRTSAGRLPDLYEGEIPVCVSNGDADGDGLEDQADILQSAIDYVDTRPKYKSKYYTTGYPDDRYGVCTDVVANALRGAGYDLMSLVQQDISENPQDYKIEKPNPNIDFRRVSNLKVFFANQALELTTDIYDIDQWQGGDIVIFKNHIGIVSDHRNADGVTYVIHHNDPFQKSYEEDILETRDDIVGHYRMYTE